RAMPYVCAALARHIYHCLKSQEPYDVEKAFGEPVFSLASEQAIEGLRAALEDKFEAMEAHLIQEEG
ncbi:MAG: hypothetical protein ACE5JF_13135, partial [Anaerolineales bacterium]